MQPLTFRVLLLVLYGTGMRVGEALRLSLRESDLHSRVLTVRDTKFFKSRLVPLGPRLTGELVAFRKRRGALPMPQLERFRILCIQYRPRHTVSARHHSIPTCPECAGIQRDEGSSYPPRLHDLRHTAAVHRVIAWYRDGADVQRLLPQLATYLGHKDLRSTQHYLTMTPELLERASLRFLHYADRREDMHNRLLIGPWIRRFLLEHIIAERNLSHNTQTSYRDTLVLLLPFIRAHYKRPLERLLIDDISPQIVRLFLAHLESVRSCSVATRNQRLAAIHSLARFIGLRQPRTSWLECGSPRDSVQEDSQNQPSDTWIRRRWMRCCRSSTVGPFLGTGTTRFSCFSTTPERARTKQHMCT